MDDNLSAVLVITAGVGGFVCLGLAWLRYLKFRMANRGGLSAQENAAIEQFAQTAQRLEQRVATLEQILDTEVPAWRSNPAHFYRQAG